MSMYINNVCVVRERPPAERPRKRDATRRADERVDTRMRTDGLEASGAIDQRCSSCPAPRANGTRAALQRLPLHRACLVFSPYDYLQTQNGP